MRYKIRADQKSYSEWSVNQETGAIEYFEHEFEGHDFLNYKIKDQDDDVVFESESWEETKNELNRLEELENNL